MRNWIFGVVFGLFVAGPAMAETVTIYTCPVNGPGCIAEQRSVSSGTCAEYDDPVKRQECEADYERSMAPIRSTGEEIMRKFGRGSNGHY